MGLNLRGCLLPLTACFSKIIVKIKIKNIIFGVGSRIISSEFEGYNRIGENSILNHVELGEGTYLGKYCIFSCTSIGRYCSIANNVKTGFGNHPTSVFVSTYPAFYYNTKNELGHFFYDQTAPGYNVYRYADNRKKKIVEIGNDVWISDNVLIMDGVKVGNGAIIAAGAVVTKDVDPYTIVGGVPAKFIKYRFDKEQIEFLQKFRWWDKGYEWCKNNFRDFTDIEIFLLKYKKRID